MPTCFPSPWPRHSAWCACLLAALLLAGCYGEEERDVAGPRPQEIGDPEAGRRLIAQAGCDGCHIIPGLEQEGLVGPPLTHMGRRIFIAGLLRNTPANMVTWLRNPQAIVPGNAMPDMGLSEEQARHITAYLYTLR